MNLKESFSYFSFISYICNMKQEKMITIAVMMLMLAGSATAYTDHRNARVDSAEQVLQSGKRLTDKERMGCYYTIVRGTLGKDTEKHNRYSHKMLELSYRIDAKNMRENALNHLGLQHYGQEQYEQAERYFLWAIAVTDSMQGDSRYSQADIDDNHSQLYGALGNLYNIQDKALLAIEYYQKALPIFERHGWLESQCILHHNVAELWLTMGNLEKAEAEYLKAIETGTQSGDSLMMALPRKGLAKVYLDQDDYEKARQTIEAAYDYYHAHRDEETDDYPEVLCSLVKLHLMAGHENLAKAKAYSQETLSLLHGVSMQENRFDVYATAAMVAMKEERWQEALGYAEQSVHERDSDATYSDVSSYALLANIHMQLGNKQEAAIYINKVRTMMERFATEHYQSGLSQMEVVYQTKQKEAQISQLQHEKRWYLWGGLLTALVLLLTSLAFFLLWRDLKLRRRAALIEAKLEGEKAERVRIARDLHDRLGGLLTAIRQNIVGMAPLKGENTIGMSTLKGKNTMGTTPLKEEKLVRMVDEAIGEMRNVAHHLLPDALSRYGLRQALSDFCQTLKNVDFAFTGQEHRIAHEEAIYCIAHELVNNAVKSSGASHIHVQLMAQDALTVINVSDDGRGMSRTDDEEKGIGLDNIRERVEALGGRLDIYSEPEKGTEVNIEFTADAENPHLGDCTAQ